MLRTIGILIAALLLDGDGGNDDAEAGALAKLSDLMDKRIDAAFERWLEKGKGGDGDPPKPPADGDPPKPPADGDPPKPPADQPAKAPGIFELLFGTAGSRK